MLFLDVLFTHSLAEWKGLGRLAWPNEKLLFFSLPFDLHCHAARLRVCCNGRISVDLMFPSLFDSSYLPC